MGWFDDVISDVFGGGQNISDAGDIAGTGFDTGGIGQTVESSGGFSVPTPEWDFFTDFSGIPGGGPTNYWDGGSAGSSIGAGIPETTPNNLNAFKMGGGQERFVEDRSGSGDETTKKWLKLASMGIPLIGGLIGKLNQPAAPKMPALPPPPAGMTPQAAPYTPLPGTKASPLITGSSPQVVLKKPAPYGGFSLGA